MEMALYLELCVLQICGIRPVLGRVEDFSKEVKLLLKGNSPIMLPTIVQI
jgi:nuclear pore complex protein Nup188